MNLEEIRELVRLMVENNLGELDITEGENKIRLKRGAGGEVMVGPAPLAPAGPAVAAPTAAPAPAPASDLREIHSPMVGTFYAAPSPESDPYVGVGAAVGQDTVVCIIEAMKVMNEIKAEISGQIVEICVKNAQPVEYGQVLFKVKVS
jgi:acetyl-CoA carboxylase biotin carboxyl carrier protein